MSSDRVLATAAVLAFVVLVYLLMLKGWRGRQRRQGDLPPPPQPPEEPGLVVVGATPGLFIGTVFEGDWLDRVAVHGLSDRSSGWLTVRTDGLLVEREGGDDVYLPYDLVDAAEPGEALAGKVVGRDGMLVVTWRLGGRTVQSGFRADDHAAHRRLADAVHAHLPTQSPTQEESA